MIEISQFLLKRRSKIIHALDQKKEIIITRRRKYLEDLPIRISKKQKRKNIYKSIN